MARPALATVPELETLLGEKVADTGRAEVLLRKASAIVRSYAGEDWLNEAGDALEGVPEDIPDVVTGMVERATQNPAGATHEQAGPFARQFGAEAAQRLYLSKWDKLVIRDAVNSTGIRTIGTGRGELETGPLGSVYSDIPEEDLVQVQKLLGGS